MCKQILFVPNLLIHYYAICKFDNKPRWEKVSNSSLANQIPAFLNLRIMSLYNNYIIKGIFVNGKMSYCVGESLRPTFRTHRGKRVCMQYVHFSSDVKGVGPLSYWQLSATVRLFIRSKRNVQIWILILWMDSLIAQIIWIWWQQLLLFSRISVIFTVFLYCFVYVIFILICFVCTSVRTAATEWQLNCSK